MAMDLLAKFDIGLRVRCIESALNPSDYFSRCCQSVSISIYIEPLGHIRLAPTNIPAWQSSTSSSPIDPWECDS